MQTMTPPTFFSTIFRSGAEYNIPVRLDLRDGSEGSVGAFVRRVSTGFFQLSTPVFLQKDTRIEMRFGKQSIETEVIFCKGEPSGHYQAGVRLAMGLNGAVRREPRFPVFLSAKIRSPIAPAPLSGRVIDISRSGLGVRVPASIPVGAGVVIEMDNGTAFGEVRRCVKRTESQWHIGVWLDEFISQADIRKRGTKALAAKDKLPVVQALKRIFEG